MLKLHLHFWFWKDVVCSTGKAPFLLINIKQLRYLYGRLLCIVVFLFSLMVNMLQPLFCLIFYLFINFILHDQLGTVLGQVYGKKLGKVGIWFA